MREDQELGWGPIFFILMIALTIAVMSGCAAVGIQQPIQDNSVYYANDMRLTVNGVVCNGVCKAPQAPSYQIKIETKEEVDQIVISTCARTDYPNPDTLGKKRKGYVYNFTPGLLEKDAGCNLAISGYLKDKGKSSSGLIVFDHEKYKLTAGVSCNAAPDYGATGVAICQAMRGQRMMVWFPRPVRVSERKLLKSPPVSGETIEDRRCQIAKSPDGIAWKFNIPGRECNYLFETVQAPYLQFVLYTVGAEQIPIRSE